MKLRLLISSALLLTIAMITPRTSYSQNKTLSAPVAFVEMPADVLDLLTTQMRNDMLDYYFQSDTCRNIPNALGGMSHLIRPVSDNFLSVKITPISSLSFRILPMKKDSIVAVTYTISDKGQAGDSELAFYNKNMHKLKTDKFIKLARMEDFLDLPKDKRHLKKELLSLVPFPTIMYTLNPDNNELTAELTIRQYMGAEDYHRLSPYLKPSLTYHWTGSKYRLK